MNTDKHRWMLTTQPSSGDRSQARSIGLLSKELLEQASQSWARNAPPVSPHCAFAIGFSVVDHFPVEQRIPRNCARNDKGGVTPSAVAGGLLFPSLRRLAN
jgi:hypothetical protein